MTSDAVASGTFTITMTPATAELPGTGRFDFTKTWSGDLEGTSRGFMLSAGNPATGAAGYVAQEVFEGRIAGGRGRVVLQQSGTMDAGQAAQRYEVAPGSGTDDLFGLVGDLSLEVVDGQHRVRLSYSVGSGGQARSAD